MNPAAGNVEDVARLIQLAVAPIFLLTAIATTLTLLSGRLSRIIERGRTLEGRSQSGSHADELQRLELRARIIYLALTLGVFSAILVSLLMTLAFLGELLRFNAARWVAFLFIGALFVYTGALVCLLREVFLAIGTFQLGIHPSSPSKSGGQDP